MSAPARGRVVYLDHGATSWPKPPAVAEEIARFLREDAGNPGRSGHALSMAATRVVDRARTRLGELLKAEPARVIFTSGATEALNLAILGVVRSAQDRGQQRPHVVSTVLEHNAAARPLTLLAMRREIDVSVVGCDHEGFLDAEQVVRAVRAETRLVCVTHASNVTGALQPAAIITRAVAEKWPEALTLVDVAQTAGLLPIDVGLLGADLVAFSAHKALQGPTGLGALYLGPRVWPKVSGGGRVRIAPVLQGGTGGDSTSALNPDELPWAFESGTPNTVGMAGLLGAMRSTPGPGAALAHERALAARLIAGLSALAGVRVLGPKDAARRTGVVSFTSEAMAPHELAGVLDDAFGICVRAGLHCAPHTHRALGTHPHGAVRASPGPGSTEGDIDALLSALCAILKKD